MNSASDLVIDAQGIVNRFGDVVVHEGLNLAVPRGAIMALVGGSGSGKTVLVRSLLLLRAPSGGTLKLFGQLPKQQATHGIGLSPSRAQLVI